MAKRIKSISDHRLGRALALRDAALVVVRARGEWGELGSRPIMRFQPATPENAYPPLSIGYSEPIKMSGGFTTGFGVDVWARGRKVLNVGWLSETEVDLISYRPGPWEAQLESLALSVAAPV